MFYIYIYTYIYRCGYVRPLESGYIGVYSQLLIPKNDLIMLVGVCIEGLRGSYRSPVEAAGLLDLWFRLFITMIEKIKWENKKSLHWKLAVYRIRVILVEFPLKRFVGSGIGVLLKCL